MNPTQNKEARYEDFPHFVTKEELAVIKEEIEEEMEEIDKLENDRFSEDERAAFLDKLHASREEREKIIELFELGCLTRPELNDEPIASVAPRKSSSQRSRRRIVWSAAMIAAVVLFSCVAIFETPFDPSSKRLAFRPNSASSVKETAFDSLSKSNDPSVGATPDKSFALDEFGFLPSGFPAFKSGGNDWDSSKEESRSDDEYKIMDEIAERLKTTFDSYEAKQDFEALSPKAQKSAKGAVLRGVIAFFSSDLKTAEQAFQGALEIEPDNFAATYNLATTLYALGRRDEAKIFFDKLKSYEEYKNNETLQHQIAALYSEGDKNSEK